MLIPVVTLSMDLGGGSNISNCSSLTGEQRHVILNVALVACSVGVVVTSVAIVVLLIFRSYRLLIFRIVLYVMIGNLLTICVQVVRVFPVETGSDHNTVKKGWTSICRCLGYLVQVTSWMGPACLLWLVLYILHIAKSHKLRKVTKLSRSELVGIGLCFLSPFTFSWIPFIDDYYGLSGSWCWIKVTKELCNDTDVTIGHTYILALHYVPLMVFVFINTIACIIIFCIWCETQSDIKVVIFVIMYPLVYDVLCIMVTTSRLHSMFSGRREQSYSLWIAHALAEPARVILSSMLVIIQWVFPFTREMIKSLNSATTEIDEEPCENNDLLPRLRGDDN